MAGIFLLETLPDFDTVEIITLNAFQSLHLEAFLMKFLSSCTRYAKPTQILGSNF